MRKTAQLISWLSLILLTAGPVLFYSGEISLDTNKLMMNTATTVWFISASLWMGRKKREETA
jgi:hypothetical protein